MVKLISLKTSATIILLFAVVLSSCSKKTVPAKSTNPNVSIMMPSDSIANKPAVPAKPKVPVAVKTPTAKVIVVSDAGAKKTFDGRLYYDLEGKRYWKNYKDGKYYLYSKTMQGNPDYKPRN